MVFWIQFPMRKKMLPMEKAIFLSSKINVEVGKYLRTMNISNYPLNDLNSNVKC